MNEFEPVQLVLPQRAELAPDSIASLEGAFLPLFHKAEALRQQAVHVEVTDVSQKGMMQQARTVRLEIRKVRIAVEKTHELMKADSLKKGRTIDSV
jgi:hypothetical protein